MIAFDNEANIYDDWYLTKLGSLVDQVQKNLVMELLNPKQGELILDLGCGTGNYSIPLTEVGCKVIGVDHSPNMLNVAKEKTKAIGLDIEYHLSEADKLDFPDNHFDAVVSVTAFEFIKDIEKVFSELMRVVKPSGRIILGTINAHGDWGKLYMSDYFQKETVFKYATLLSKNDLQSLSPNNFIELKESLFLSLIHI